MERAYREATKHLEAFVQGGGYEVCFQGFKFRISKFSKVSKVGRVFRVLRCFIMLFLEATNVCIVTLFCMQGYENRIIFVTDAQPNAGDTSKAGLVGMVKANAMRSGGGKDTQLLQPKTKASSPSLTHTKNSHPIHTTMVGVGLDLNTQLVSALAGVLRVLVVLCMCIR